MLEWNNVNKKSREVRLGNNRKLCEIRLTWPGLRANKEEVHPAEYVNNEHVAEVLCEAKEPGESERNLLFYEEQRELPADDLHVEQRAALGGGELRPEVLLGVFQVDAGGAKGRGVILHVHQGAAEVPEGGGGEGDVRAHKALGDD